MAITMTSSGEPAVSYVSFPIEKTESTEDGDLIVYGKATDGSVDSDEQIVDPDWSARALHDWLNTYKNIRFQHQAGRPIGKGLEIEVSPDGHYVKSLIVETEAKNLVRKGVLQAYSVGIARPTIVRDTKARGGRITGGEFVEISLVDRPANKNCGISLIKAAKDGTPEWIGKVWGGSDILTKSEGTDTVNINLPGDVSVSFTPADLAKVLAKRNGTPETVEKRDFDRNVGGGVDRDKLRNSDFAGRNRSFPIVTQADVSDALHSIGRAGSDNYDADTLRANILRIARRKGFSVPDSDKPKKGKKNKSIEAELAELEARLEALKSRKDPDNDGDDDSTAEGDTDHDFWTEDGKQKKPLPGKKNKGDGGSQMHFNDQDDDDVDGDADEDEDGQDETETPDTAPSVQGKSHLPPEIATAMRLKSARIPHNLGMLHDLTCAAFSPEDVQKCYPGGGFHTLDTLYWQHQALQKAGDGSLAEAKLMSQLWQYAETLKESRLSDTLGIRFQLHKAFQDANPGPGHAPTPAGQIHAGSYNRPLVTAGHEAASPGHGGPNTAKVPADSISASQYSRGPLTAGHESYGPGYDTRSVGIKPPSQTGHLAPQSMGSIPESNLAHAMSAMHDHIAQSFPDVCPFTPGHAIKPNAVPTAGGSPSPRAAKAKDVEPDAEKCIDGSTEGPSSAPKPQGQIDPDSYNRGYLTEGHSSEHPSGHASVPADGPKPAQVNGLESDLPVGKAISFAVEKSLHEHLSKFTPKPNEDNGKSVAKAVEKALSKHLDKITPPPTSTVAENAAVNVEKAIADYLQKASANSTPSAVTKMAEVDLERAVTDYLDKASARSAAQKETIRSEVSEIVKNYVTDSASPQPQPITPKALKRAVTAALKKAAVTREPVTSITDTVSAPQPESVDIKSTVADAIKEAMAAVAPAPVPQGQTMDLETFADLIRPEPVQAPPPSLDKEALAEVTRPLLERLRAQEKALEKQQKVLRKREMQKMFDAMPPVPAPQVAPVEPVEVAKGITQEDLAEFMRPLYDRISAQDDFMRKQEKRLRKQQEEIRKREFEASLPAQTAVSDSTLSRELINELAEKMSMQPGITREAVEQVTAPLMARLEAQEELLRKQQSPTEPDPVKEATEPLMARLEAQEKLIRKQQKELKKQQRQRETESFRQQLLAEVAPQPARRNVSKAAGLSELSVPILERLEAQEKLIRRLQKDNNKKQEQIAKTVDAMASMPDPNVNAYRGFGINPYITKTSAGPAGAQNVADVAERTQAMMLEEFETQFRTSPDPFAREAAWKMIMKMRGLTNEPKN